MNYISSPTHNIDKALGTIAVALGDVLSMQGQSTDPDIISHLRKSRLAVTKALVLGILSIHGHKDRDAFVWALSTLGIHSTILHDMCFQQYYCICGGIPDSFTTNGSRRRSLSNERWISHQQHAEEMNEEGPYNGSYLGARHSPEEREHILEIPYLTTPLLYNGPFQKESPFGYFTTIPQPPTRDNIYASHPLPTLFAPSTERRSTQISQEGKI